MQKRRGQSLVEIAIALAILVMGVGAASYMILTSYSLAQNDSERIQASLYANEGIEATQSIRDRSFTELADGTYGLAISGGNKWVFSGSSDTANGFTRTIVISTVDADTKLVVATVSWTPSPSRTASAQMKTLFTNWQLQ